MKIHFIGIGGIGMSALAAIALKNGEKVTGSDTTVQETTTNLKRLGVKIYIGHKKDNLPKDLDLVVFTNAVEDDNPELKEAKNRNIDTMERAEYLSSLFNAKKGIAVAGTHGKTTTSSMISMVLKKAKLNPTVAIGGLMPAFNNQNWSKGRGEYFVIEACEYRDSFLNFKPYISLITNIEEDHLDYFKDINHIIRSFDKFLNQTDKNGFAVIGLNNLHTDKLLERHHDFQIHTYGGNESNAEWKAENIKEAKGRVTFEVWKNSQKIYDFELFVPGKHNAFNALAAIIVCAEIGINLKTIKEALQEFKGTSRRSEMKGEKNGVLVIDDYAHHPTEIKATLEALRNFYSDRKKMWCVYQPHQYSRTKFLLDEFSKAFDTPDTVIIPNIYKVRDSVKDIQSVNSEILVKRLKENNVNALHIPTFEAVAKYLKRETKRGDLLITMGAGPVDKVADLFLK